MAVTDLNGPAWILGCRTVASGNEGAKTLALIAQHLARHRLGRDAIGITAHHNRKTANKVYNALQSASVPQLPRTNTMTRLHFEEIAPPKTNSLVQVLAA